MDRERFLKTVSEGYDLIPISKCIENPSVNPIDLYESFSNKPQSYLFESLEGGRKWSRYTIIGLPSSESIDVQDNIITISTKEKKQREKSSDPIKWIDDYYKKFKVYSDTTLPEFQGGLVGYFGFDSIKYFEPKIVPSKQIDDLNTPDIRLIISKEILIFDKLNNKIFIIVYSDKNIASYENAVDKISNIDALISEFKAKKNDDLYPKHTDMRVSYHMTKSKFIKSVDSIKSYILNGDVMQVVLSQRMTIPFNNDALAFYKQLRSLNPSPYMYYLNLDGFSIIGSSPEILVRLENQNLTVRPIAGTRPRGSDEGEDSLLEYDLKKDPKEIAEHLMLIDLGRNDIGRVSEVGTVRLTDRMIIEKYSHVMHMVSNVVSKLKSNLGLMDVLRATFPAGTVSGAPKIRALEIIYELESVKRGIYAGAIGYLGWNGNMDTAIAIRTCIIKDSLLNIQCGAGIVFDSVPEKEWEETINKGMAIIQAYKNLCGEVK